MFMTANADADADALVPFYEIQIFFSFLPVTRGMRGAANADADADADSDSRD